MTRILQWLLLKTGGFRAWHRQYLSKLLFDLQLAMVDADEAKALYKKTLAEYNKLYPTRHDKDN